MEKITDIFDRFNNTIGNHIDGKATDQDLINIAYEIDKYLLQNPHPHDLVKNHGVSHHVIKCDTCIVDENKAAQGLHVRGMCDMPMDLSD